ncbi:AraC family transcriptional regulator [Amantichitinum ursilacus]|uniref:CFA/I fimbrial subunit D n=1 Tax=Amantichitinum ursilacus TaxID=857265 RepID=A0A0N0XIV7_9NEIS|nr:AraC family transcriptional regulator [Amantichitinum ursilacus]KPC52711.1 CFA/I fimbrial subunit D [Amantichitinum ursilacus]
MTPWSRTVTSKLALLGLESARAHGLSPREFQRITGIAEAEARDPQGRIAAEKHIAMLNLTERMTPLAHMPHSMSAVLTTAPFSTVICVVANSPTLQHAFANYLDLRGLIGDVDDMLIKQQGDYFEFEYQMEGNADGERTGRSAFGNLMLMARLARQYLDDAHLPVAIELTGKPFPGWQAAQEEERCRLRFGAARNRMALHLPGAAQAYALHNRVAYDVINGQAQAEVQALQQKYSFAARVQALIDELVNPVTVFAGDNTLLEMVCERLHTSRFTLHRLLQKEDTHFQRITAQVRLKKAKQMLLQEQASISNVSDLLGFSSVSAFSRFFSAQSGLTPSRFKSMHRAG